MNDNFNKMLFPKIFGYSRRIIVLEVCLKNYASNQNNWCNLSEIARIGKISVSTVKRIVRELEHQQIVEFKKEGYQTPVKNPEINVRLNSVSKISKELIFFYQKLRGII